MPVAGRTAAGDRARRRPGAVAVGARHRPSAGRPVRPAARPEQPPSRAATRAGRRRSGGATSCSSPTTSADCGRCPASPAAPPWTRSSTCWRRWACRRRRRSTRSAGSSTGRWSASTPLEGGEVRYRLLDSIRAYAAARLRESGQAEVAAAAHAAWYADDRPPGATRTCAATQQPACLAIARAERANVDVALAWCAVARPAARRAHRQRVRLDLGGARRRHRRSGPGTQRSVRPGPGAGPRHRLPARRMAGGVRRERRARPGRPRPAPGRSPRSSPTTCWSPTSTGTRRSWPSSRAVPSWCSAAAAASLATYRPRGLRWRDRRQPAARGVRVAHGRRHRHRHARRDRGGRHPDRRSATRGAWCTAQAMLGAIAQAEHRFDDAARGPRARRRASPPRWASSVRPRCTGPRSPGCSSGWAIRAPRRRSSRRSGEAVAGGDGRLAATARLNLARLRRGTGDDARGDRAAGGERAVVRLRRRWRLRAAQPLRPRRLPGRRRGAGGGAESRPGPAATSRSRSTRSTRWPGWRPPAATSGRRRHGWPSPTSSPRRPLTCSTRVTGSTRTKPAGGWTDGPLQLVRREVKDVAVRVGEPDRLHLGTHRGNPVVPLQAVHLERHELHALAA